jgi:hypothetical protein
MIQSALNRTSLLISVSVLLFVSCFPVLDILTHPVSVMHGFDYLPLVLRLSDFYWETPFFGASLIAFPLLLLLLAFLTQRRSRGLARSLLVLVTPFALALLVQYFIAVQLDKYVQNPLMRHPFPWKYIFQVPFMLDCFFLLLIYVTIATLLWLIVRLVAARRP